MNLSNRRSGYLVAQISSDSLWTSSLQCTQSYPNCLKSVPPCVLQILSSTRNTVASLGPSTSFDAEWSQQLQEIQVYKSSTSHLLSKPKETLKSSLSRWGAGLPCWTTVLDYLHSFNVLWCLVNVSALNAWSQLWSKGRSSSKCPSAGFFPRSMHDLLCLSDSIA